LASRILSNDADVMRWHTAASTDPGLFDQLTEVRAVVEPAQPAWQLNAPPTPTSPN
jgi:hypothetical protein